MRHNQNARRGSRGGRGGGGGHHHGGGNHSSHHNNNPGRRVNPRVQVFDSNGPEVRIRGTAYQINEKYVTLARDAAAAGDRVLGESYLQHAEHYQRFINEMTEEFGQQQQTQPGQQPHIQHFPQPDDMQQQGSNGVAPSASQPPLDGHANGHDGNTLAADGQQQDGQQPRQEQRSRHQRGGHRAATAAVAAPAGDAETG